MARQRFRFNHGRMDATPVKVTAKRVALLVFKYLMISFLVALAYYAVFAIFYDTKEERALAAENRYLKQEYEEAAKRLDLLDNVSENIRLRDIAIYREVFNSELPDYVLESARKSSLDYSELAKSGEEVLMAEMVTVVNRSEKTAAKVSRDIDAILKTLDDETLSPTCIPSSVPVRNFRKGQTGASCGAKFNPFLKTLKPHEGLDIVAPPGTDVLAPADGTVISFSRDKRKDGTSLVIDHGNGLTTEYKHLASTLVQRGQRVRKGSVIARVGSSGRSFAPHLHYEVRLDGKPINPVHYLFSDLEPSVYSDVAILGLITGQSLD